MQRHRFSYSIFQGRRFLCLSCIVCLVAGLASPTRADDEVATFELRDGDRVVLVGNTFIEREQNFSYLETFLRTRWPSRTMTFRNLGWSGDTVRGAARGYEKGESEGLARLDRILREIKPTVLIVGYGMNESFAGEAGLTSFRDGLEALLDRFADLDARVVLIGPIQHEALPSFPDPSEHNRMLKLYSRAMAKTAAVRGCGFVDLFDRLKHGSGDTLPRLTGNGIHLTPLGYWRVAMETETALGLPERGWAIDIDGPNVNAPGVESCTVQPRDSGLAIRIKPRQLPIPPPPSSGDALPAFKRVLAIRNLLAGEHVLSADGAVVAMASAEQWARGVSIENDPPARVAEQIRVLAVEKNTQFFNQWRPANEPYIFGFRSREQSRNQVELPRFDDAIQALEQKITELSQPTETVYELTLK